MKLRAFYVVSVTSEGEDGYEFKVSQDGYTTLGAARDFVKYRAGKLTVVKPGYMWMDLDNKLTYEIHVVNVANYDKIDGFVYPSLED